MTRHSRGFNRTGTQQPVRQHNVATQRLRNGRGVTNSPEPAGLTTRPISRFSPDSLQCSATSGAASRQRCEETAGGTVGCGVLSEAAMSDTHADTDTHDDSRTDSDADAAVEVRDAE